MSLDEPLVSIACPSTGNLRGLLVIIVRLLHCRTLALLMRIGVLGGVGIYAYFKINNNNRYFEES